MNLNELVYRLENSMGIDYDLLSQAANKLRQQQTMIDEYIKATDYWMKLCQEANANYTPQIKELSDEEIKEVIRKHWNKELGNRGMLALCKAILKKASEK
jgi:hypothetical protein